MPPSRSKDVNPGGRERCCAYDWMDTHDEGACLGDQKKQRLRKAWRYLYASVASTLLFCAVQFGLHRPISGVLNGLVGIVVVFLVAARINREEERRGMAAYDGKDRLLFRPDRRICIASKVWRPWKEQTMTRCGDVIDYPEDLLIDGAAPTCLECIASR